MLNKALQIVECMDQSDANVIALKSILNSIQNGSKLYMLKHKGKFLRFYVSQHDADFSMGSTVYLNEDTCNPIWTTENLNLATYVKYFSTPWFNSTMDNPTHEYKYSPKDIEVVDSYGRIYNRKLLTNKTKAIIKARIFNDYRYINCIDKGDINPNDFCDEYSQLHLLKEAKEFYLKSQIKSGGNVKLNFQFLEQSDLDYLYNLRKTLLREKWSRVGQNKSIKLLQKRIAKVTAAIINKGGK